MYQRNKDNKKQYDANYYKLHRDARIAYVQEYYRRNKANIAKRQKIYREKNKFILAKKKQAYRTENASLISLHQKEYYLKNKNSVLNKVKAYRATENGRQKHLKSNAVRDRKLNWIGVFKNIFDEPIEWHHVDDEHVVPLPVDLHRLYLGKNHRENLVYIIKQLFR
jgi:hypothetical protein